MEKKKRQSVRAEQPQLSQPVLIGEVFHPSDHFCGPPLDPLQQVHVFPVLRTLELDAVLQVGSHQSGVEGHDHLPQPAGHASFAAAQDTVGFLGRKHTLLAHVQLFIHQYPQVLLCRAALNPLIPQPLSIPSSRSPILIAGVAPAQVQDPALGLFEPHGVPMGPLLELVQVPLDGIPSLRHVNHTTQLGVVCKLAEGALNPTVHVIDEDIKQYRSQYGPLRDTTHWKCNEMQVTYLPTSQCADTRSCSHWVLESLARAHWDGACVRLHAWSIGAGGARAAAW
ncbi:hypothetical protein QYF61_009574 [Mycteria americana]|uniref:Uncharacterized protein n=1 Tax=Mycteria americana TaxID=33587 RepID=A0AAN7SDI8_MYCAM|nr:hypothetical protein QYF61_009574 [Mycteria americana]